MVCVNMLCLRQGTVSTVPELTFNQKGFSH